MGEIKKINIPAVVIGNLCDLENDRKISKEEGEKLAKENNLHFYESSNKLRFNIEEPIDDLIEQILKIREMKKNMTEKPNKLLLKSKKEKDKEKRNNEKEKLEKEKLEEKIEKGKKEKEENFLKIYSNLNKNYLNNNLKYIKY